MNKSFVKSNFIAILEQVKPALIMFNPQRVLVVVAHPDDEVLGCGGTIRKLVDLGADVHVVYMNNGCDLREPFDASVIRKQIEEAAAVLGATISVNCYATARFGEYDTLEFNSSIQSVVNELCPDLVMTHDHNDLHQDHRKVHEAVMIACRFKPTSTVKAVWTFPVISSSDISPRWAFEPDVFVSLTDKQLQSKINAMTHYKFELKQMAELRGEVGIKSWATFYGLQSGCKYAEPFRVLKMTL